MQCKMFSKIIEQNKQRKVKKNILQCKIKEQKINEEVIKCTEKTISRINTEEVIK